MPGWHSATRQAREEGDLELLGIVLEQHPARARLFMQWQGMRWPLLHDPFNRLALPYVPLTLAIDEWGIIRAAQPLLARAAEFLEAFLAGEWETPAAPPSFVSETPDFPLLRRRAKEEDDAHSWALLSGELALWCGDAALDEALALGERALGQPGAENHATAQWLFQQGVIHRMRYDSARAQPTDFHQAVVHWSAALEKEPNNYIWRRRLQQYGPRLAKPYSFYDWVPEARVELRARGEEPIPLAVEPGGAEFARPAKEFTPKGVGDDGPRAAEQALQRDDELVQLQVVAVPKVLAPGEATRLHIRLQPLGDAHWNNESEPTVLVLGEAPPGWCWERRRLWAEGSRVPTSTEPRRFELELRAPHDAAPAPIIVHGYALYFVCAEASGVCLHLRQDFSQELLLHSAADASLKDPGPPRPGTQD